MMKNIIRSIYAVILLVPISVLAETIVIDGELLNDLRRTPVLGGGFSLTTEDYKSLCFDNVETTIPSYDYDYTFYSNESETKSESKSKSEYSFNYGFKSFGASGNVGGGGGGSTESQSKVNRVNMFAVIRLNSYYASLNESKSILSQQAKDLIQSEDVIGFFDACGTYYIRTINRYSRLYAWLTLESKETVTANSFKYHLEASIRSRFVGSASMKAKGESESKNFFKNKQLYIKIIGIGLAKEHVVNLSPTSMEDFKKVINNASKSMSGIHTGRISSLEIIPWMDNLSFQRELKPLILKQVGLSQDQLKSESLKRKWIVAENGEFISMLKNKYRALQAYQFASMNCQSKFERILSRDTDWKNTKFKNHLKDKPIKAEDLYKELVCLTDNKGSAFATKNNISASDCGENKSLYKQWEEISKEADNCLNELYPQFTKTIYRDIAQCQGMVAKLTALMPAALFYYCAPKVTN
jgi:tetrahydromethanopterin S-methyltransferase subunit G